MPKIHVKSETNISGVFSSTEQRFKNSHFRSCLAMCSHFHSRLVPVGHRNWLFASAALLKLCNRAPSVALFLSFRMQLSET